ncbi:MAG: hypothetical protein KJ886_04310 [Candidatus Thermoplasmatota archaeon]|nr:hypothetical protein [Candidatus Thermoplasmatota archaeon]
MHYTDRGDHLRRRKKIYEEKYPESKADVIGGVKRQNPASEIISFAEDTASKLNISLKMTMIVIASSVPAQVPLELPNWRTISRQIILLPPLIQRKCLLNLPVFRNYEKALLTVPWGCILCISSSASETWLFDANTPPFAVIILSEKNMLNNHK